jgi:4-nitrophenyl phosphatase
MGTPDRSDLDPDRIETVLCDLDGVIWLGRRPVPGAVEAIEQLRNSGRRVLFVTNNSVATRAEQAAALGAIGVPAEGDVVTSAMAAAVLVEPGWRVLVAGGPGVDEAVAGAGAEALVNNGDAVDGPVDAVVAGLHRDFDYARLRIAARAVLGGARFIATNTDATYPVPDGLDPGGGAIVSAIATVAGVEPVVAGKPHLPMGEVVRRLVAPDAGFDPATVMMVGDRPETDGVFASVLGAHYAQVRSGVVPPGGLLGADVDVTVDVADLAALAARLVA